MAVTTHSFKYKPTTAPSGTEDRVLACSHTTDDCHCVINASGQIGYYVSGVFTQMGTATVSLNEQYAFIIEHDTSGNGCIYLNGQKIGCATNFPTTAINQIGNFKTELKPETGRKPKVGLKPRAVSNIYTRPCCGVIDEYARFNRALSASEVVDLSQSGTLSKVYTLADYKIALMADDGIIATTEKPRYKENWRSIWDADQRTSALPTAIASITVNGSYKSLAIAANDAGIWTPTTNGTPAYDYYQSVESWRQMFFVSSGGGTGFLLTANLAGDTDISEMSPTLEARQSALMFAEDALRSAVMIKRQLTAVANANAYTNELEDAIRQQTDHAIVFTTSASDPSTGWTAEEKLIHKGDYWRVNTSSAWKTWTGTTWGTVNDAQAQAAANLAASAASTAQTTANAKRRVFTATPTSPYDVGDLWVAGTSGDIKKCKTARSTGSYLASEWELASKYTDDTTANTKSRTFIQTTAPSSGMQAGDYWLDSDDNYKPYVYKDSAWSVDYAMQSAINAQNTADKKTTLWATLAVANSGGAVAGDMFMDSSLIYRCLTSAPNITVANSTRITSKNFGNLSSAPTGAIANDRYYNTSSLTWYRYTGSAWTADGTALNNVAVTYAPKYLGRYHHAHPASYNNGDWWLVYSTYADSITYAKTRGFWYSNNGTPTLITTLPLEAQRKYRSAGLEDVLYASNNGFALTSTGVYDPVTIYGVSTMEFLATNQAFIAKLMVQEMQFQNSISSVESGDFTIGDNRVYMGKDSSDVFSLLFQSLVGKAGTEKFWANVFRLYGSPTNALLELKGDSYADGGSFSGYSSIWSNYRPPLDLSFPTHIQYTYITRTATMGVAYVPLWGLTIVRLNYTGNLRLFVSTDDGNTYPLNPDRTITVPTDIMVTCAKNYGNFLYVGTTGGLYMVSSNVAVGSSTVTSKTSTISSEIISIQEFDGRLLISSASGTYTMPINATTSTTPTLLNSSFVSCAVDADDSTNAWFTYGHVKNEGSMSTGSYVYKYSGSTYSSIYIPGKTVNLLGGGTIAASTVTGIAVANNVVFMILYTQDSPSQQFQLRLVKSTDDCSTLQEIAPPAVTGGLLFSILTCHNGILVLRATYGQTFISTDMGASWTKLNNNTQLLAECRASFPMYTVTSGARRMYIACPNEADGYTYYWTQDQRLGASGVISKTARADIDHVNRLWDGRYFPSYASIDEVSPKKYFMFPAGTTHATIYNALVPYRRSSGGGELACIGTYNNQVCDTIYTGVTNEFKFALGAAVQTGGTRLIITNTGTALSARLVFEILVS